MEYRAVAKNIKMSPRKVRLVADALRELSVDNAVKKLELVNKRAANPLRKTIQSAIANAINNENAKRENLTFKEIKVDEGITYKRYRFASRGRVAPYLRRTSHITVVLEDKLVTEAPKTEKKTDEKEVEKKEVKKAVAKKDESKKVTSRKGGGKKE